MLGVKTTLAMDRAPLSRACLSRFLGLAPEGVPAGWNFPARRVRACCGHPRLFWGLALQASRGAPFAATSARECLGEHSERAQFPSDARQPCDAKAAQRLAPRDAAHYP